MRNLAILFFSLCMVLSCTNSKEEFNKQAALQPKIENTEKTKKFEDKSIVKVNIEKNNDQIKAIEKEINALLKDF